MISGFGRDTSRASVDIFQGSSVSDFGEPEQSSLTSRIGGVTRPATARSLAGKTARSMSIVIPDDSDAGMNNEFV
jgi:hypothetical protein